MLLDGKKLTRGAVMSQARLYVTGLSAYYVSL